MPQPNPPQDPHATVKMIPGEMFETREFTQAEVAEKLASRQKALEDQAAAQALAEAAQNLADAAPAQSGSIQPPPSTSSSR